MQLVQSRTRNTVATVSYHALALGLSFFMLYPILWLFASSFKSSDEIWTNINSLIPSSLHFENYINGWSGFGGITFTTFYSNSFFYAVTATILTVCSSALIAYGFSRINFKGRSIWFAILMMTLMLPNQVLIIPQYIIFNKLGWINSFLPLIAPAIGGNVFFVFMIMQFIRGIPLDLDEAAQIDGCDRAQIFFRIILPNIVPALVTAGIFCFYWTWEDFMMPLIYLGKPALFTVSVALRSFADPASATDWGAIFAMLALSIVPVFAIFVFFQRYLVEGIATTGLKG